MPSRPIPAVKYGLHQHHAPVLEGNVQFGMISGTLVIFKALSDNFSPCSGFESHPHVTALEDGNVIFCAAGNGQRQVNGNQFQN